MNELRRFIFVLVMTVSISSLLVLIGGFIWGSGQILSKESAEIPISPSIVEEQNKSEQDSVFRLVGLGDSLTRGVGDSSGKGYYGVVSEQLEDTLTKVQLNNLAVSGSTSRDLIDQLQQSGVQDVIAQADMLLMTIGGNDLSRSVSFEDNNEIDREANKAEQLMYMERLQQIIDHIRAINATSPIYFVGLYNPFGGLDDWVVTEGIVMEWNYGVQTMLLPYTNITFVPVADLFQGRWDSLLSSDQFHPNQAGYELMAERVNQLIAKAGGTP